MDIIKTLRKVTILAELDDAVLQGLASVCRTKYLHTGQRLYQANDPAHHVYIIVYGRLKLTSTTGLSTYLGHHEIIGEMGVISRHPHHGTVHAIRDTALLAIPQQQFTDFIYKQPNVLLALSRLIIARSQPELQHTHAMSHSRTLSIVPAAPQIPAIHLAEKLTEHLQRWPHVRLITAAHVDALFGSGFSQTPLDYSADDLKLRLWLASLEEKHCYVLYAAHSHSDEWAKRCLHQADRILILAEANLTPIHTPLVDVLNQHQWQSPIELVVLRSEGDPSTYTRMETALSSPRSLFYPSMGTS